MPQGVFPSLLHPASQRRSLSLLLGFSAAIILICFFAPSVYAQMSVTATYDGQLYPVVGRKDYFLFVSKKNGDRVRTNYSNLDLRPSKSFGSGVALITNAVPDYNPPKSASTEDKPVAFRYDADISADRKLSDVYALLPAVVNGSICTEILPIGSLSEHQTKHVHFDYASKVENIGFLHVFCAGVEITSSQVKQPYDAAVYFESLKAKSKGVPAAALCKSKRFYAMSLSDDGSHLACAMDRESHFGLLIYDLITMKITGEVDVGALKDPIFDLRWVSATQLVYLKGNDLRTNDLYLLDITEQKIRKIANEVTDIVLVYPTRITSFFASTTMEPGLRNMMCPKEKPSQPTQNTRHAICFLTALVSHA